MYEKELGNKMRERAMDVSVVFLSLILFLFSKDPTMYTIRNSTLLWVYIEYKPTWS